MLCKQFLYIHSCHFKCILMTRIMILFIYFVSINFSNSIFHLEAINQTFLNEKITRWRSLNKLRFFITLIKPRTGVRRVKRRYIFINEINFYKSTPVNANSTLESFFSLIQIVLIILPRFEGNLSFRHWNFVNF